MRIGSGVQSAPEVFGKRQNNSKTSAVGNEEFSQTSVKVYLKTDDMLFSGGNGTDREKIGILQTSRLHWQEAEH